MPHRPFGPVAPQRHSPRRRPLVLLLLAVAGLHSASAGLLPAGGPQGRGLSAGGSHPEFSGAETMENTTLVRVFVDGPASSRLAHCLGEAAVHAGVPVTTRVYMAETPSEVPPGSGLFLGDASVAAEPIAYVS